MRWKMLESYRWGFHNARISSEKMNVILFLERKYDSMLWRWIHMICYLINRICETLIYIILLRSDDFNRRFNYYVVSDDVEAYPLPEH